MRGVSVGNESRRRILEKAGLRLANKHTLAGIAMLVTVIVVIAFYTMAASANSTRFEISASQNSGSFESLMKDGAEPKKAFVHVAGCVQVPGLYELEEGSRVFDAIQAAGGATETGSLDSINLACALVDGMKVYVPSIEEQDSSEETQNDDAAAGHRFSLVSINNATIAQLESLPGIGKTTARKIIEYRDEAGPFTQIDQLLNVSGIGEKKFAAIEEQITL